MPRKVEDIIPTETRRSIRDIPVPLNRRKLKLDPRPLPRVERRIPLQEISIPITKLDESRVEAPLHNRRKSDSKLWTRKGPWITAAIAVLVLLFSIMSLMRSAVLSYKPKTAPLTFNHEIYSAYKTGGTGILLFSVVKLTDDKSITVPATGDTQVTRRAEGTVVIYNNSGPQSQKLIKTTRLETASGKVYRIQSDVTVPGKTGSTPGSVEVLAVADQAGPSYNIGLSDFTLPGLKGTAKYTTIYARSKTPMTGGANGTEKTVDPAAEAEAQKKLEDSLRAELVAEATAQVPADFILYPSLATTVFETQPQSSSTSNSVNINVRGNFYGVIFKRSDLTTYLKSKKLAVLESQNIEIPELDQLPLTFVGGMPQDLIKADQINFEINGNGTAIWLTDEVNLKKDLSGRNKTDLSTILNSYPGIATAEAVLRPFWKTTFPADPKEITLKKLPLK